MLRVRFMKRALVVYWHPEPESFNGSMFRVARHALSSNGYEVRTSDLHHMHFDPVSSRSNFATVKDPVYFKPQVEEVYATTIGDLEDPIDVGIYQ